MLISYLHFYREQCLDAHSHGIPRAYMEAYIELVEIAKREKRRKNNLKCGLVLKINISERNLIRFIQSTSQNLLAFLTQLVVDYTVDLWVIREYKTPKKTISRSHCNVYMWYSWHLYEKNKEVALPIYTIGKETMDHQKILWLWIHC